MSNQDLNPALAMDESKPADDLQFDLSDMDMDFIGAKTASPFEIDLSSLFTSTDSASFTAVQSHFSNAERNPSYDACESSSESTTSRDGAVSVDLGFEPKRKKPNVVQTTLPNFTPLVLTGTVMLSLLCCWIAIRGWIGYLGIRIEFV